MKRALASMLVASALFTGTLVLGTASLASAQTAATTSEPTPDTSGAGPSITISMPHAGDRAQTSSSLRILALLTILSIAPGILISMTSFTRIVVVLSFVRTAVGTQNAPPTQVVLSLALLLTGVVMAPIFGRIHDDAFSPWMEEQIDDGEAYRRASHEIRGFLLRQTREDDLILFHDLSHAELPATQDDVSLHLLVPAFLISELRTGFEMGFLLFLPFVLVDLVVGSVLASMGMVMMPPTMISTPIKLLLFVLVDGWALLTRSLVASFGG